jgi:hypothetical protein
MLKRDYKPWYEKYCLGFAASGFIVLSAIITCLVVLKPKKTRQMKPSNYKVLYDRKLSESLIERTLPLPPFPIASNV